MEPKCSEPPGPPVRVGVLTASDSGFHGQRPDRSGEVIRQRLQEEGFSVLEHAVLPDDLDALRDTLASWCDQGRFDLILTTGGTGFSPRDVTPEATLLVVEREAPGIPEAMRARSLEKTPHAMLSRARAGIRGRTLIVNMPGSPRACSECLDIILPALGHAVEVLRGDARDCAQNRSGQ